MLPKILTSIFGSRNDRLLKQFGRVVERINAHEGDFERLDDAALRAKTDEFRQRVNRALRSTICCPGFAVVREAGKRSLKMRHFDVQLIGGIALHQGNRRDAHRRGKTLVATLPVYLNALGGKAYTSSPSTTIARRDAEWMGRLYTFLGLTVGVNVPAWAAKKAGRVRADVTYGTTTNSVSTICATTWSTRSPTAWRAASTTPSSTRSIRS